MQMECCSICRRCSADLYISQHADVERAAGSSRIATQIDTVETLLERLVSVIEPASPNFSFVFAPFALSPAPPETSMVAPDAMATSPLTPDASALASTANAIVPPLICENGAGPPSAASLSQLPPTSRTALAPTLILFPTPILIVPPAMRILPLISRWLVMHRSGRHAGGRSVLRPASDRVARPPQALNILL